MGWKCLHWIRFHWWFMRRMNHLLPHILDYFFLAQRIALWHFIQESGPSSNRSSGKGWKRSSYGRWMRWHRKDPVSQDVFFLYSALECRSVSHFRPFVGLSISSSKLQHLLCCFVIFCDELEKWKMKTFFFRDASEAKLSKTMQASRKAREQTLMCHIDYSDQNNSSYLVLPASLSCFLGVGGGFFFLPPSRVSFSPSVIDIRDGVAVNLGAPWRTKGWRPRGDAGLVYAEETQRKPRKQGGRMGWGEVEGGDGAD